MSSGAYHEVKTFRDPDGVVCVVTEKKQDGRTYHSFAFMREFERDGEVKRTAYLNRRHLAGARRLISQLEEWLDGAADRTLASRAR